MKIIHVLGMSSYKFGGIERFLLSLMHADRENEYVLVYNSIPSSSEFIDKIESLGKLIVLNTSGVNYIRNIISFIRLCFQEHPDVIHFHFEKSFSLYAPLARLMGARKIFKTEHSCFYRNNIQIQSKSQLSLKFRLFTFNGLAYHWIDEILAVSSYVLKQHIRIFGDYPTVKNIYLGVEKVLPTCDRMSMRAKLEIPEGTVVVASILFASPIKGCDILMKAIPEIITNKDFCVIIIGMDENSPFTSEMKELASQLKLVNKIKWIGVTDHVIDYLAVADIYCQPSRTEALSLAAVEAASLSLPIIGANVGGLSEIANDLFEKEDSIGLASLLSKYINDKELRKKVGSLSLDTFNKKFDMQNSVKAYAALYNQTQ